MDTSSVNHTTFVFPETLSGNPLILRQPVERIVAFESKDVLRALRTIDARIAQKKYYLAGAICYEVGSILLDLPHSDAKQLAPLIDFYVFEGPSKDRPPLSQSPSAICNFSAPREFTSYQQGFEKVQGHIKAGDTYQVNYTFNNSCQSVGNSYDLFEKLRHIQPSKYSVYAQTADHHIVSLSPELFFAKIENRITTKPMKGTLPADVQIIPATLEEKLRAENLMIVDLLRNDLARIARPATVRVDKLMEIEEYPTLRQIVSTISAELEPTVLFSQILHALFPCGSITGAPKRRTMEIIGEVESGPRGLYTGTIGYITPNGDMQFNVAIRTLWGANSQWSYGIGGGVVYDSKVLDEYEEALLKARFLKISNQNFHIFETLRVESDGTFHGLEDHLARLEKSAEYFGFPTDEVKIRERLREALNLSVEKNVQIRLRLAISADGEIQIDTQTYPQLSPHGELKVRFSMRETDPSDVFLRHKTSNRDLYDSEWKLAINDGFYDILFKNSKQEVTEASRHNIFIRKKDQWFTPALECGLLPGTERARQIVIKDAKEKILYASDLLEADEVVLTNALRGTVSVKVVNGDFPP